MREGKIMKKLNKKKGFTLAELLIVVAIIAVLVAIAVPVFSGSLAKAEEAVKNANKRAARAEASVDYIVNNRVKDEEEGKVTKYEYTVSKSGEIKQKENTTPTPVDETNTVDSCEPRNDSSDIAYDVIVYITGKEIKPGTSDESKK